MALHQVTRRTLDCFPLISGNDGCSLLITRQVLPEKGLRKHLVEFDKLYINKKNNNGPKNNPWTSPYVIGSTLDL